MRSIAIVLVFSMFTLPAIAFAQSEATAWRQVAEAIPLGSKVKLQTVEGKRLNGTLMHVGGNEIMLKRNTRRPEPALTITFDRISKLERDNNNGSVLAKAAAIGAAAGAGVFFTLIWLAMQLD